MLPVTFGIHKTFFLVASTLAARLGPKPVYRNAKCRGGAERSAQAKPSADLTPSKMPLCERSFRKPRTAASFVPKACKTQARKKASQKRCVRNPSTWCRNCWQRIRKGHTPLQAELGQAKNDAFATLPHGAETAASKP